MSLSDDARKAQNDDVEMPSGRKLTVTTVEHPAFFYTNNVIVRMSNWDFLLDVGQVKEATESELVIETQATIAMSPQHAKSLARLFSEKVKQYEDLFGTITLAEKEKPQPSQRSRRSPKSVNNGR